MPFCAVLAVLLALPAARAAQKLELKDGDRVVLLGNTLIEREQRHGYWEAALTIAHSDKNITFRNLGWSGDTVWGEARARFGGPADGFRHLKDHVVALKPTVILLGYGLNESFAGEAGLPNFQKGLETLLDTLAPTKARIVILSPLKQEKLPQPLPDPAEQNKNIKLYRDVLQKTAEKRGHGFVDLFELVDGKERLTDNGIHLTAHGYWATGLTLSRDLGNEPAVVEIDAKKAKDLAWKSDNKRLPYPGSPAPAGRIGGAALVRVAGLAPGKYTLQACSACGARTRWPGNAWSTCTLPSWTTGAASGE